MTTIRLLAGFQPASTGLSSRLIKLVAKRQIERRNVRDHRRLRLERLAQLPHLGFDFERGRRQSRQTPPCPSFGTAQTKLASRPK